MPSDRDTAARALAEAMGWHFDSESGWFDGPHPTIRGADTSLARIPAPDAPLHAQLGFIGRLAEAVGARDVGVSWTRLPFKNRVCFILSPDPRASDAQRHEKNVEVRDGDLVLAGMLAATEAARSKR